MKACITLLFVLMIATPSSGQNSDLLRNAMDIGNPKIKGSSGYDMSTQVYTLQGSGYNIWFERDEFHFRYDTLKADFILTAHVSLSGEGVDPHRKIGWMIRASLEENAAHVSATLHGDGLTVLQWRELKGAFMRDPEDEVFAPKSDYNILQLERKGDLFIMRAAHDGEPLQLIGKHHMPHMPADVLAGLFVCSHNPEVLEEGRAWNVRIDRPVPEDHNAYSQGRFGSRLEILDINTGMRKVIYESKKGFEAPNWTHDGEHLIINQEGSLYSISINGGALKKIDTGFADRLNNDHGISPDGKTLAISHHRADMPGGGSTIYVLPLEGGQPRQVTEHSPSYWHGWSPDGKYVVYVGERGDGAYHIFRANVESGAEEQITDYTGSHVDGPEYDPHGEYIYYNGTQSGTMQIWRMRPNGGDPEQLTFDQYNDWFPHISPDGETMVFISFPENIEVNDHPFYKRVMLRTMPVKGGAPRVIAHLYGGQGTINVPSWSPDSQRLAFVSNPGLPASQ
ncbi:MAG: TolB family protein [Saprospiraceae bacterium]|nr:TolB family protein [Saprospiraceae bacterium]